MSKSNISWTEQTWNPIVGCSIVSPGCKNCYAMKMANRLEAMHVSQYAGTTHKVNGNAVWTGKVARAPEKTLMAPLKRKIPTTYFVNSMGDLFHEDVPDEWIDQVFAVMALCPQHTFQILTKRAERMEEYSDEQMKDTLGPGDHIHNISCKVLTKFHDDRFLRGAIQRGWPLKNVWLGVSAENQEQADKRIPHLLNTPASIRFVSLEPQLERIDLTTYLTCSNGSCEDNTFCDGCVHYLSEEDDDQLDWVIQGCESGHGARAFDISWAYSMRDKCAAAGVPYFLKQMTTPFGDLYKEPHLDGVQHLAFPNQGGE